jgi:hypothetical protein
LRQFTRDGLHDRAEQAGIVVEVVVHGTACDAGAGHDDLRVDQMMISPAYAYWKAPDQEHFLGVEQTRELFR